MQAKRVISEKSCIWQGEFWCETNLYEQVGERNTLRSFMRSREYCTKESASHYKMLLRKPALNPLYRDHFV